MTDVGIPKHPGDVVRQLADLRKVIERLASAEAFTLAGVIADNHEGRELRARMKYAQENL